MATSADSAEGRRFDGIDRPPRVWFVLPAYDEEASLPPLLESIAGAMAASGQEYEVLVVDDGSRDRTAEIAQDFARRMPLRLERHPRNLGLGAAMRTGLTGAARLAAERDAVVTMDSDNSHPPELVASLLDRLAAGADVAIASRYRRGSRVLGVSLTRRALSYWGSWLFRVVYPVRGVRDYTCGYRAYRTTALRRGLEVYGDSFFDQDGFQCMVDILLKLARLDLRFAEAPLVLRYDLKAGRSKMRVARTMRKTLVLLARRRLGLR